MSFYDPQAWQVPMRETTWEQPPPSSRPDMGSTMQHQYQGAFHTQFEEVDRALDNLAKSGKLFNAPSRRDSMPMMGGPPSFSEFPPRMPQRHSIGDYEQIRPHSGGNLQKFYANQRHQPRQNEAEQMMQAKRRMAAQRERELRNYHQEQQYNRSVPSDSNNQGKSDRAISPNTMNEEDRRELIARQHRALYGNEAAPSFEGGNFGDESHTPRPSQSASGNTSAVGGRGSSPRSYEPFLKGQAYAQGNKEDGAGQLGANDQDQQQSKGPSPKPQQQRSRDDCTSSPASNPPGQNFNLFEAAQQSSRTSTSSPGGSPPRQAKASAPGVAPIGTRPQTQVANPALNKRSGTPSQSPLSYGFASNTETLNANPNGNERSTSSASNPASGTRDSNVSAWGTGSGVWGNSNNNNNKSLGVQASVWG